MKTDLEKNAQISAAIFALVTAGVTVDVAYDMVMGKGAYAKLAGEVYDSLNKKSTSSKINN